MQTKVMFTRYVDGARPVKRISDPNTHKGFRWELANAVPGEPILQFSTNIALMQAITGHPTGRHWSPDRYFRIGKYKPTTTTTMPTHNVFDIFPKRRTRGTITLDTSLPLAPSIKALQITKSLSSKVKHPDPRHSTGIDLAKRHLEVAKLLFAGFGKLIYAAGYDSDDVLQEVYKGLWTRNNGKCPWDSRKSTFGHYVHMVAGCILSNYHRKQKRRRLFEQNGLHSYVDGSYQAHDAALAPHQPAPASSSLTKALNTEVEHDLTTFMLEQSDHPDSHLASLILPYVTAGFPRKFIAIQLTVSMASLSRAISHLRKSAASWAQTHYPDAKGSLPQKYLLKHIDDPPHTHSSA